MVLLSAPAEVLLQRIETRTTNDYGKATEERELILQHLAEVEPLLRATCTHEIDATQPVSEVVAQLVEIGAQLGGRDHAEVLDRRERVVEVMEQRLPLLVAGRLPEPLGVILERLPLDEQEIAARALDARAAAGARRSRDSPAMIALAVRERGLELRLSTGLNVEDGLLRDHPRIIAKRHRLTRPAKLHPRLHPRRNGYRGRGALASDAMITMTFQRGTGLTPRQREVVALIAAGCSNDEVGERLGISPRTAKAHSDTLRSKLGVSRRRQIPVAFRVLTGEDPLSASLGALHRPPGV